MIRWQTYRQLALFSLLVFFIGIAICGAIGWTTRLSKQIESQAVQVCPICGGKGYNLEYPVGCQGDDSERIAIRCLRCRGNGK